VEFTGFPVAALDFYDDLEVDNTKSFWEAHKHVYAESVKAPMTALCKELEAEFGAAKIFRPYRDVRFAKDKTPYKTHVGITFYHEATKALQRADAGNAAMGRLDAPLLYLHIQQGESFTGGGIWHPQPQSVKRIRDYMLNNPASWKQATRSAAFTKLFELGGESLSRPPKGYDPAHELIDDLKRKDFIASTPLSDEDLLSPELPKLLMQRYRLVMPLLDWLCGALDLDF